MELAKAYVQIIPSAKGLNNSLTQAMGGEVSSAGDAAGVSFGKNLVGAITKVVAAAGIGAFIKQSLDAGGALQQSFGGLDTIYGDASEAAKEYAKEAAKAGISMNDYAEQAVSFGASLKMAFAGDTAKAVEAANTAIMDMTDNAAKMGTPLESIQNAYQGFAKQNYTMLDNLKLGYGGTKKEMERLLADANAINAAQGRITNYSIDNLGDVYDAIHVVQGELGLTGVAAQEASETFTGSMGAMKAAWENVKAGLATGGDIREPLRTMFENARVFLQNNMFPMLANVLKGLPDVIEEGIGFGIQMINIATNSAPELIRQGVEIVGQLVVGIISAIPSLADSALRLVMSIGETLLTTDWGAIATDFISSLSQSMDLAAGEIFGSDSDIIDALIGAITNDLPKMIETAGETIISFVSGLLDKIPMVIDTATTIISRLSTGILGALPNVISAGGETMAKYVDTLLSKLPDILNSAIKMITTLTQGISQSLPKIVSASVEVMKKLISTLLAHLPEILQAGIRIIFELAGGIIRSLPDIISAAFKIVGGILDTIHNIDWLSLGVSIVTGIIQGLWSMAGALWDAMKGLASNAFGAVKDFFGINSPSRLMRDQIGRQIPAGIAEGIEDNMGSLRTAMADMATEATGSFSADVVAAPRAVASQATTQPINYGGVTINVTADDVERSRDFVDWLEGQLAQRTNNRRAGALA